MVPERGALRRLLAPPGLPRPLTVSLCVATAGPEPRGPAARLDRAAGAQQQDLLHRYGALITAPPETLK